MSATAGSVVLKPATLLGSTSEAALTKKSQIQITIATLNFVRNKESVEDMFSNLQVGAPMRRCEKPSPGPPSRRCRFCSRTYRLGVHGRRITGYPTSVDRRNIRTAARPSNQGRSSLVLFIVVVDDPHKPATLVGMAGRALAHRSVYNRPRWNCFSGGWLHSHWPLPSHSIICGRRWTALVLVAAGVFVDESWSAVYLGVYPR